MNASALEMPLIFASKSTASPRSPVAKSIHLRPSSLIEKLGDLSSRNGDRQDRAGLPGRLNIRHRTGTVNLALASSIRVRGVAGLAAALILCLSWLPTCRGRIGRDYWSLAW